MADFLALHKDKVKEFEQINSRRDTDNRLITSHIFTLKDLKDQRIDDVLSVTMNNIKIFTAFVEASLNKADEKVVVETENANIDTTTVENYIRAYYRSANLRLRSRGEWQIDPFIDQQNTRRGESALRIITQTIPAFEGKDAFLDTNITTWDTRFMTYETAINGLAWAGYETQKSRGAIEAEPWALSIGFSPQEEKAKVLEGWTLEENLIYVGETLVFTQPNPFGFVPVVVQAVPMGSMLADEDSLRFQKESILFLVRDLIDQYNLAVSILQTLNLKAIKAATQEVVASGQEPSEFNEVNMMGSNTGVSTPNAISQVPYGDAKNSMILALQEINKQIEAATLSRITLGDLPGELSAVALLQIEQGQGQVFLPRLATRGLLKQQAAEMFIKQTLMLQETTVEVGSPGHRTSYKTSDLEGDYDIEYFYTSRNPDTEFARGRMAKEMEGILDPVTIKDEILRRDDPEGDQRKLVISEAVAESPALQKWDRLIKLREAEEMGDEQAADMAQILELEWNITLEDLLAGRLQREAPRQPTAPLQLEGPRNSNEVAADIQRTASPEI
ncbi:hypothetical protein LCGC14_0927010 [marine sediment metagenome]|uniref:Uncharacterized protein n=1 Tax=marine sediment metagenome TaxID=412755 RepID=A0A0F9NPA4_9ZZZZ